MLGLEFEHKNRNELILRILSCVSATFLRFECSSLDEDLFRFLAIPFDGVILIATTAVFAATKADKAECQEEQVTARNHIEWTG